jgi:ACS family tartrate transporter-like MFS transporter
MNAIENSASHKFRWRVLLPLVVLIVMSSLDRVNISFASIRMNADIGLTPQMYGTAVGAFFVGYLLCQFPSTWLLTRFGARRWIAGCVSLWGVVALATAYVHSAEALYGLRFLLGCAESGFAPGVVYYCSGWMPARHRANTIAITMLAVPISVIVGGPLCGWLMQIANPLGMPGWRWMLLIEGAATATLGLASYFVFVDKPRDARWLNALERAWIETELTREQSTAQTPQSSPLFTVLRDRRAWLGAGVWCTTLIGANGMIFWLPQTLKEMSGRGDLAIGMLTALPWIGVAIGMIGNSWHSDRTQERYWHVGLALGLATAALLAASLTDGALALLFLFGGGLGLGAAQGVFWSIPTSFLHRSVAAAGITLINLIGNLGSLFGPYVIGVIRAHSASFAAPIWFVVALLGAGAVLLASLRTFHDRSR